MLGLYHDTLIFGHKLGNILSILNKLTFQRFATIMCFGQEIKNTATTTTKPNIKYKTHCQSRESHPGPLAPRSYA